MAINFPNSPVVNQLYTYDNKTWEWNGTYWEVYSALTNYVSVITFNSYTGLTEPLIYSSITGGTYSGGTLYLINNSGGTSAITGFYTGGTDVFVTGGTYSAGTTTFTNNTGGTFNVTGFYTGATDVFVTGGTYSSGTATFRNNTGGTFNVTGFYTGATDVFVTGGTYSAGTTTFRNNTGGTFNVTGYFNGSNNTNLSQIFCEFNGLGGVIQPSYTGVNNITANATITGWTIFSMNPSTGVALTGNIDVDIWIASAGTVPTVANTIFPVAANRPNLTSQSYNSATGLSISVTAGQTIMARVISATTCVLVNLQLQLLRT